MCSDNDEDDSEKTIRNEESGGESKGRMTGIPFHECRQKNKKLSKLQVALVIKNICKCST